MRAEGVPACTVMKMQALIHHVVVFLCFLTLEDPPVDSARFVLLEVTISNGIFFF